MNRAFSLVEVLIVIAILSVTFSIISPTFLKTRTRAKETIEVSNCRQIFQAMIMYKGDHGITPQDITDLASYLPGMDLSNYEICADGFPIP